MGLAHVFDRFSGHLASALVASSGLFGVACGIEDDGDATAVDPLRDCVITAEGNRAEPVTTATGSYAETGRIVTAVYVYELDEALRTIAVNGNDPSGPTWYWTDTYDAVGHVARLEHRDGTLVEFENTYDGERILTTDVVPLVGGQGYQPGHVEYFYEDTAHPDLWTRQESSYEGERPTSFTWTRTAENGHVVRAEQQYSNETTPRGVWTYAFDGDVLATIERDQGFWEGSDGVPNIRFSWLRDEAGRLTAFEQDGTDSYDDPRIDGEPDFRETYSPGCSELLDQFPWLAHVPDRDETTPGYRVAGVWRPDPGR